MIIKRAKCVHCRGVIQRLPCKPVIIFLSGGDIHSSRTSVRGEVFGHKLKCYYSTQILNSNTLDI